MYVYVIFNSVNNSNARILKKLLCVHIFILIFDQ